MSTEQQLAAWLTVMQPALALIAGFGIFGVVAIVAADLRQRKER